jgi:hypothetical protein
MVIPARSVDEDATRVLRRAREASGGADWATVRSIHTRAAIETGGLRGRVESWDDVAGGRYWFSERRPGRIGPPWEREDGERRFHVVPVAPLDAANQP